MLNAFHSDTNFQLCTLLLYLITYLILIAVTTLIIFCRIYLLRWWVTVWCSTCFHRDCATSGQNVIAYVKEASQWAWLFLQALPTGSNTERLIKQGPKDLTSSKSITYNISLLFVMVQTLKYPSYSSWETPYISSHQFVIYIRLILKLEVHTFCWGWFSNFNSILDVWNALMHIILCIVFTMIIQPFYCTERFL